MALADSGTMALAGNLFERSIQVELGGNGTTQISMNDTAVRALGEKTASGSAINMSTDFYGKSNVPAQYLPVSLSGNDSATDSSIPAQISPIDNVQITGTTYWRRVRLTYTGNTATKRLYVRAKANNTVADYRGDVQAIMYVVNNTEYQLIDQTDWQRVIRSSNTTTPTSGWANIDNSYSAGGRWMKQTSGNPTGSSGTGRLQNFIDTSKGFIFIETSSTGTSLPKYYWLRGPTRYMVTGTYIDFYYGVDCPAITEIYFYIA